MDKEMETGGRQGFKELNLSYYIGEILCYLIISIYIYTPIMVA